ncbi:hypothetical protein PSEUDO8O_120529 [Pseudomonas sp. 8O]|nr:hypothetical protein PSEUDO8O_120529 [Pseudomonas sp. 8O]
MRCAHRYSSVTGAHGAPYETKATFRGAPLLQMTGAHNKKRSPQAPFFHPGVTPGYRMLGYAAHSARENNQ